MSISARIAAVTVIAPNHCSRCNNTGKDSNDWDLCPACHGATKNNPVVRLRLEPLRKGEIAGQETLTIINPPTTEIEKLKGLVGTEIWGGSNEIMIGEIKWANRIGYTKVELIA